MTTFFQCTKILSYTSPLQFYPSKFVLVTDLLDLFGDLVYLRLKSKSEMIKYVMYKIIYIKNYINFKSYVIVVI